MCAIPFIHTSTDIHLYQYYFLERLPLLCLFNNSQKNNMQVVSVHVALLRYY